MASKMKLVVSDNPFSEPVVFSGTAVWVKEQARSLEAALRGERPLWEVQRFDEARTVTETKYLATREMVIFLTTCTAAFLIVPVNDAPHLLHLILTPRVILDMANSHIEYFDRAAFFNNVLESFVRDLNMYLPAPTPA